MNQLKEKSRELPKDPMAKHDCLGVRLRQGYFCPILLVIPVRG